MQRHRCEATWRSEAISGGGQRSYASEFGIALAEPQRLHAISYDAALLRRLERPSLEPTWTPCAPELTFRERIGALSNLPPLFRLVWAASPLLLTANLLLRLVRAFVPVAMLWVGKLIVDEVVRVAATDAGLLGGLDAWGGALEPLAWLLAAELGLAVLSDVLGRGAALCDSLLGDLFTNETSVRLMRHAARLDLAHFEDAEFYDKLERARRQTTSRLVLLSQIFGQAQSAITIATLGVGLAVYAPLLLALLVLALLPAFLGEAHFNAQTYSLAYSWTPERRELDYLRWLGASDEPAKEVKVFGLSGYLADRYHTLADAYYRANRTLATRRAAWGTLLAAVGTLGYYAAYAVIVYRTASGAFTIGDLTFLAGSFARMRGLLEGCWPRSRPSAGRRSTSPTCSPSSRSSRAWLRAPTLGPSLSRSRRASGSRTSAFAIPDRMAGPSGG